MDFYLKTERGVDAELIDEKTARNVLKRLRHQGRRLVQIFVLTADGTIECYQERTRRKLGSNAIASRTWLCETVTDEDWTDGHYVPEPQEAIDEMDPEPSAVVLVLQGADAPEEIIPQLSGIAVAS